MSPIPARYITSEEMINLCNPKYVKANIIGTIKLIRVVTGLGLKEAKRLYEQEIVFREIAPSDYDINVLPRIDSKPIDTQAIEDLTKIMNGALVRIENLEKQLQNLDTKKQAKEIFNG